jgi:hypothetical protein
MGWFEIVWLCVLSFVILCNVMSMSVKSEDITNKILLGILFVLIPIWIIIATGLISVKDNIPI